MKENWFKIAITTVLIFAVVAAFFYQKKQIVSEKRLEIFKICMSTVSDDVLRDFTGLKDNISICERLSKEYKQR